MVKLLSLLICLFASFKHCPCSLLSDVFSKLDEGVRGYTDGVKQEKLKNIFIKFEDTLMKRIDKWKQTHTDGMPLQFDLSDDLMVVLKNIPQMHREKFVKKLNKFLRRVSKHKKTKRKQKNLISPVLVDKLKLKPSQKLLPATEINVMKRKLKKNAKKWIQPSFMNMKFKETTKNKTEQSKGGKNVLENWIGKHFKKPHHLSTEDKDQQSDMDILNKLNSAMDKSKQKPVEYQVKEGGVGKTLMNGVIEERMALPWQHNLPLSKMSQQQKRAYMEAERKWELKLSQETQRLLDKLQPADAYIVPDLPIFYGEASKNKPRKQEKVIMTGNEDWKIYAKLQEQKNEQKRMESLHMVENGSNSKITTEVPKKSPEEVPKKSDGGKLMSDSESFKKALSQEEHQWFGVEKNVMDKIRKLERFAKKQLHD